MRAMVLRAYGTPLVMEERPDPLPGPEEILMRVQACGVCRTDLHVVDGELPQSRLPIVPGHEVVGRVEAVGSRVRNWTRGMRAGIPWLGHACGVCEYCRSGRENLCDAPGFTGCTIDGGYATHAVANAHFALALGQSGEDVAIAPLLCAGVIGWRSMGVAGPGRRLGLYGFGAAAHIVLQAARWQGRRVFAFTRPGDVQAQDFARQLGAEWAGGSDEAPPHELDAAIIYAPVGDLVPTALRAVRKGGRVVCAGIHMSDIPSFSYRLLWEERQLVSVANLTRADAAEFMRIAPMAGIATTTVRYPLAQANAALQDLRSGQLKGAAVLVP